MQWPLGASESCLQTERSDLPLTFPLNFPSLLLANDIRVSIIAHQGCEQDPHSARLMFQKALQLGDSEAGVQLQMLEVTALAAPAVEVDEDENHEEFDYDGEGDGDEEDYEEEYDDDDGGFDDDEEYDEG